MRHARLSLSFLNDQNRRWPLCPVLRHRNARLTHSRVLRNLPSKPRVKQSSWPLALALSRSLNLSSISPHHHGTSTSFGTSKSSLLAGRAEGSNSREATIAIDERAFSDRLVVTHFWPCNPALPRLTLRRPMMVALRLLFSLW